LINEKKFSTLQLLLPVQEAVVKAGKPIIAEDVEGEVQTTRVVCKLRGGLKVAAVKTPGSAEAEGHAPDPGASIKRRQQEKRPGIQLTDPGRRAYVLFSSAPVRSKLVHFAVRIALQEQLRRKARLRRKRMRSGPAETTPTEPPLSVADKYRASLCLLGKNGLQSLRKWKARGHCTYGELAALLPSDRSPSPGELDGLTGLLRSLAIELRGAGPPREPDRPLFNGKRILLVHPDTSIVRWIVRALEDAGAEVLVPRMNFNSVLACADRFALDGAVLNFISDRLPVLRLANRLHARKIPVVFYTAFDTRLVAQATAHMNRAIVSNPGSSKTIVSALASLMRGGCQPQSRSFLDN
jgi:hypothetical protein